MVCKQEAGKISGAEGEEETERGDTRPRQGDQRGEETRERKRRERGREPLSLDHVWTQEMRQESKRQAKIIDASRATVYE